MKVESSQSEVPIAATKKLLGYSFCRLAAKLLMFSGAAAMNHLAAIADLIVAARCYHFAVILN